MSIFVHHPIIKVLIVAYILEFFLHGPTYAAQCSVMGLDVDNFEDRIFLTLLQIPKGQNGKNAILDIIYKNKNKSFTHMSLCHLLRIIYASWPSPKGYKGFSVSFFCAHFYAYFFFPFFSLPPPPPPPISMYMHYCVYEKWVLTFTFQSYGGEEQNLKRRYLISRSS